MSYFAGLVEASFKKGENGKTIFYPYGALGSGYVLSEESESNVKSFVKRYLIICLPAAILSSIVLRIYAIPLLIIFLSLYVIKVRRLLLTEKQSSERMTLRDITKKMARSMGLSTCLLLLIMSIVLFLVSIVTIISFDSTWVGILGSIFFGTTGLQAVFLVKYAGKHIS